MQILFVLFVLIGLFAVLVWPILKIRRGAKVLVALSVGCGWLGWRVGAAAPTVEQRLTDLEAYIKNAAPESSLVAYPGLGHNGWMMTSAALVLFMTLPGLALFYGGLVRRKNVLSVVAECVGLMGIVTMLWWIMVENPLCRTVWFCARWAPGCFGSVGMDSMLAVPSLRMPSLPPHLVAPTLSAAVGLGMWALLEQWVRGKPSTGRMATRTEAPAGAGRGQILRGGGFSRHRADGVTTGFFIGTQL